MADYLTMRYSSGDVSTLGLLFKTSPSFDVADRKFLCYIMEDEYREVKVPGETRISAGRFQLKLRTKGGMHFAYAEKYGPWHRGMIWLQDVPDFEWSYIHTGNKHEHTKGCLLTGDSTSENITEDGIVGHSVAAYKRIYSGIVEDILAGDTWLTVQDFA